MSDIHSNLAALDVVLAEYAKLGLDGLWCLGDVVGYGPQPNACIERVSDICEAWVAGNHDLGSSNLLALDDFNREGQIVCAWTEKQLNEETMDRLRGLGLKAAPGGAVTLVHGSPRDPVWEYVLTLQEAQANFEQFDTKFCFFGHTHLPIIIEQADYEACRAVAFPENGAVSLALEGRRYMVNPGSVGQSRDGDARSSFLVFDAERQSVELVRLGYDIEKTQACMTEAGLPITLIERLEHGL